MYATTTRAMIALSVFAGVAAAATADDLKFGEIEQRLAAIEQQWAEQNGVQPASYFSDAASGYSSNNRGNHHGELAGFWYAELQMVWLRLQQAEPAAAQLEERHYFGPRVVLGYENPTGIGFRTRYFHWGNRTQGSVPVWSEWDVLDLEATGRVRWGRTNAVFAGGFRYTDWDYGHPPSSQASTSLSGLTLASDARTLLWSRSNNSLHAVYGARFSMLGGDWRNLAGNPTSHGDNVMVRELNAGLEYRRYYTGGDFFARTVYEMQNWDSDAIDNGTGGGHGSVGLHGPGVHLGVAF